MQGVAIWVTILVISLIVEGMTSALVSIWFVPSAVVCIVLELCGIKSLAVQTIVFAVLSALLVFLLRDKIKKSFTKKIEKTNADSLIGKIATAQTDIPQGDVGRVKVGGMSWAAYTDEPRSILAGEKLTIEEIIGVKLRCVPAVGLMSPTLVLVGKKARACNEIDNFSASGTVLCDGKPYPAASLDNTIIKPGTVVIISEIREGKAVCLVSDEQTDVI